MSDITIILLCWVAFAPLSMFLLGLRYPSFGRWYWPEHKPLDGWLIALIAGPIFTMTVLAST